MKSTNVAALNQQQQGLKMKILKVLLAVVLAFGLVPIGAFLSKSTALAAGSAATNVQWSVMKQYCQQGLDTPYLFGGDTLGSGFDCSGYVTWVLKKCGATYTHYTADMEDEMIADGLFVCSGTKDEPNNSKIKPGDIIFYFSSSGGNPTHCAIAGDVVSGKQTIYHAFSNNITDSKGNSGTIYQTQETLFSYPDGLAPGKAVHTYKVYRGCITEGWITLTKRSSDTSVTAGDSNYSLEGAVYGVYTNASCTTQKTTLTTNANGVAKSGGLEPGTYYVKEKTASKGYQLDTSVYTVKVTAGATTTVNGTYVYEDPIVGTPSVYKSSTNPSISDSHNGYTLSGAIYGFYSDAACTSEVARAITNSSGYGVADASLPVGTYYVKEIYAPEGFELDTTRYSVSVTSSNLSPTVYVYDTPLTGSLSLRKVSASSTVTSNNDLYSLAGAKYGVYYSRSDARYDSGRICTLTTNANGYTGYTGTLPLGTYFIKELSASKGYELDSYIYSVNVSSYNQYPTVTVYETPAIDPVSIAIAKVDKDINKQYALGGGELAGAEFTVYYYDTLDISSVSEALALTPMYTWTIYTNANGFASIPKSEAFNNGSGEYGLPLGTLLITETKAPEGYLLPENPYTLTQITQDFSGSTTTSYHDVIVGGDPYMKEQVIKGDIAFVKYGSTITGNFVDRENNITLEGVKFQIINNNDNPVVSPETGEEVSKGGVVCTLTTDENGAASTESLAKSGESGALAYGSYIVREVASTTPEGYATAEDIVVTISEDEQLQILEIVNKSGTAIQIAKKDAESDKIVSGIMTFGILDANNNPVVFTVGENTQSRFSTDNTGKCILPQMLKSGQYYLTEIQAPDGYLLNTEPVPFTIDSSTVNEWETPLVVSLYDYAVKGQIEVSKIDKGTGKSITTSDMVFGIYAAEDIVTPDGTKHADEGDLVDEVTADGNNKYISKKLPLGSYQIIEITAPDGYVLNSTPVDVKLVYAGQTTAVVTGEGTVADEPVVGIINITKIDAVTNEVVELAGAEFDIIAVEDIVTIDGTVRAQAGEVVDTVTTDETGKASSIELYLGEYKVVETKAPIPYAVNKEPVNVELAYAGQETEVVYEGATVADTEQLGTIKINKFDKGTQQPIETTDMAFEIYAAADIVAYDGDVRYTEGSLIETVTANAEGDYVSSNLYLGSYEIVEKTAPFGYVLNTEPVPVELTYENQDVLITSATGSVLNLPAMGVINVTKYDNETGFVVRIPGTTFKITANEDIYTIDGTLRARAGETVAVIETDETGKVSSPELYLGSYTVTETKAPYAYILDSEPQTVVLSYAGQDVPVVYEDIEIGNTEQKGQITLTKLDVETKQPITIAGVVFEIYAADDIKTPEGELRYAKGELIGSITTDATGVAVSDMLYLGKYNLVEVSAPAGYVIDSTPIPANIEYMGQNVTVSSWSTTPENQSQMGVINVTKLDKESGETVALAGAVFEIYAAEDIVTADNTVRAYEGDLVDTITTTETGSASSNALYLGSYRIHEITAPYGYVLDSEDVTVSIDYAGQDVAVTTVSTTISNTAQKGVISILKTDDYTGDVLENATFKIYAAEDIVTGDGMIHATTDTLVDTVTTSADGTATSDELYLGNYYLVEIDQPVGYVLDSEPIEVSLVYDEQTVVVTKTEVEVKNLPTGVIVEKYRLDESTPLKGVEFGYWDIDEERTVSVTEGFGKLAVELDDITGVEDVELGAYDQDGNLVSALTASVKGYLASEDLEYGVYDLRISYTVNGAEFTDTLALAVRLDAESPIVRYEVSTASVVDDEVTPIEPSEDETLEGDVEDGTEIEDEETVPGNEGDEGDEIALTTVANYQLANWKVTPKCAFVNHGDVTYVKTDKQGSFFVRNLTPGTYGFGEFETLPGYVLQPTAQYVTVTDDGYANDEERATLVFENDYTKVQISKQDITTGEELPGATLTITTPDGTVIDSWVSTDEPYYIDTLPAGDYILREESAPEGYLISEEVSFTVMPTGEIQTVVMYDDYTKLEIVKIASDTGKALKGAVLALLNAEGDYVDIRNLIEGDNVKPVKITFAENGDVAKTEPVSGDLLDILFGEDEEAVEEDDGTYGWITTDEAVTINHLLPGEYTLVELEAPNGYRFADDINFTVEYTGDVQYVEMVDELIPFEEFDKTGVSLPISLLGGGLVLLLGSIGGMVLIRRKEY